MSKIFDESLLLRAIQGFWKRSVASATAFADRYRFDPFLRTQINIVGILLVFAIFLLTLIGVLVDYLYQDIALAVITGVRDSLLQTPNAASVPTLESIRLQNLSSIAVITAVATIAFGYLLTRVALGPTREALSSQKQFIGNIAHELRTPLSVIKTNTEVALLSQNIGHDTRGIMNSTIEELDRLSAIINNLLSLSTSIRPERMEFSTVDISSVAAEVIEKLGGLAHARRLEITFRKGSSAQVWGNPAALEQVLMNIVKNAINYTSRGGHVSVTIEQIGESHVEIVVQDSGTGIAKQDLFHIFEPFYRAEPSRNRAHGGSGLGLTIVSELVKMHRGKITVRSALGRGTTVVVALPAAPSTEADRTIRNRKTVDEVAVDFSHRRI